MPVKRILCPVDFSPGSDKALTYAVELARELGAEIEVLHAFAVPTYQLIDGAFSMPARVVAEQSNRLEDELDRLVKAHARPGVTIRHRLVTGAPTEVIGDALSKGDYDLVVMGTHGRTGLKRAWLGSVAERVVRTSPTPVITVPLHEA